MRAQPDYQADGVLESLVLGARIAEYNQQKAEVKIISLAECQEQWDDSLGPLLPSQGQSVSPPHHQSLQSTLDLRSVQRFDSMEYRRNHHIIY